MKRRQIHLILGTAAAMLFLCIAAVIYGFTNNFGNDHSHPQRQIAR
jgi:hypothetical protein